MRRLLLILCFYVSAAFLCAAVCHAQCPPGVSCSSPRSMGMPSLYNQFGPSWAPAPVQYQPVVYIDPAPVAKPAPALSRYRIRTDDEGLSVVVEGVETRPGHVDFSETHPFNARALADARAARAASQAKPAPEPIGRTADPFPGGVAAEKLSVKPAYTAPSPEAKHFVAQTKGAEAPAGKIHVTVIGSDDERAPVVNDLLTHPAFAEIRDTMLVQGYKPGEWPVDPSLGFQAQGKPSIIVQMAKGPGDPKGGREMFRAFDYSLGPDKLAQAIRKADPHYKPDLTPGPNTTTPGGCPLGFSREHRPFIVAVAIGLVILLKLPRKEG